MHSYTELWAGTTNTAHTRAQCTATAVVSAARELTAV